MVKDLSAEIRLQESLLRRATLAMQLLLYSDRMPTDHEILFVQATLLDLEQHLSHDPP